jgi:uncharacterized protein with von Willebrand factor type A (vWA) domain
VLITGFVEELRASGIPVSMVEAIDAARALLHTDLGDRGMVKAALGATLVKDARHWEAFETAFEVYFGLRPPGLDASALRDAADAALIGGIGGGAAGEADLDALVEALFRALRDEDDALLAAVVRRSVAGLSGWEPGRPVGGTYYLYRILRRLDVEALGARLLETASPGRTPLEARLAAEELDLQIEAFRARLRAEIRARLVADRGAGMVAATLRRPLVEDVELSTATREELAAAERAVHPLSRRLAVRLARRRRRGRVGRLDVRRTVRRSLSFGGVPADPRFRPPRPGKPEIVLLCDVSGSVSAFARFTMHLVFALSSQFSRVRSFAFVDAVAEVTGFFGAGTDFGEALQRMGSEARVVGFDGHSDYGTVFGQFAEHHLEAVTPRSTVIVTGDARTNYHDPNLPAFERIAGAARALYWLNPERPPFWNTGDSVIGRYAALCDRVVEVRNLRQLEAFVERVALPVTRPVRRPG